MEKYICENVFVPLRSAPTHRSEMLSQVLFGEKYVIADKAGTWIKIETLFDNYSGWIDNDHLQHTHDSGSEKSESHVLNRTLVCYKKDRTKLVLEAGCEISNPNFENKSFTAGKSIYTTGKEFNNSHISFDGSLADIALKFINSPYIWGGRIPSGIDCSGFTQLVYKIFGMAIPRDSRSQVETGKLIDFIDECETGDLLFFDDERGKITHVGMLLSKGLVIHASGRVRIDTVDHQGIFKAEKGGYSHKLRAIRRMV